MRPELPFPTPSLVCVLRVRDAEAALWAAGVLAAAGVRALEVPTTIGEGWAGVIAEIASRHPHAVVGAGTVLEPGQARAAVAKGARFVVSPILALDVVAECIRLGVASIPAGSTPTEIFSGMKAGAAAVKVFPAGLLGGPAFFRALSDPLPGLPLVASGGVRLEDLAEYRKAGAAGVVLGKTLLPEEAVARRDARAVGENAARYVHAFPS